MFCLEAVVCSSFLRSETSVRNWFTSVYNSECSGGVTKEIDAGGMEASITLSARPTLSRKRFVLVRPKPCEHSLVGVADIARGKEVR